MVVFSKVRLGVSPDVNALATIIVGVVTLAVIVSGWLMIRSERRRERDVQAALADRS